MNRILTQCSNDCITQCCILFTIALLFSYACEKQQIDDDKKYTPLVGHFIAIAISQWNTARSELP
jgi:hypothetical protein